MNPRANLFEAVRRGDDLITRIEKLHNQAQEAAANAIDAARAVGELLIDAKKRVGHGQWLQWLSTNVSFSAKTATNYMRVARELPKLDAENRQRVSDLSFRDLLGSLATDTGRLARLEESNADEALSVAQSVPLKRALSRARNADRIQREQVPMPAECVPDAASQPLPSWRVELCERILELARRSMRDGVSVEDVLEALNDAYSALQDGAR